MVTQLEPKAPVATPTSKAAKAAAKVASGHPLDVHYIADAGQITLVAYLRAMGETVGRNEFRNAVLLREKARAALRERGVTSWSVAGDSVSVEQPRKRKKLSYGCGYKSSGQ